MLLAAVMTVSLVGGTMMTAAAEEAAEGKQLSVQVGRIRKPLIRR